LGLAHHFDTILAHGLFGVDPGIVHVYGNVVVLQFIDNIDNTGIAQIGAVFLEGQAHDQYTRTLYLHAALGHALDQLRHHVLAHTVVQPTAGQNDFRVIADGLRLVRQVIRVHANAVPAHQAGPERQEVPLGTSSFQHGLCIDAQTVENNGQLV